MVNLTCPSCLHRIRSNSVLVKFLVTCQRPFPRYIVGGGIFLTIVGQTLIISGRSLVGRPSCMEPPRIRLFRWWASVSAYLLTSLLLQVSYLSSGQHLLRSGASAGRASGSCLIGRSCQSFHNGIACKGACSSLGRLQTVRSAVSTLRTMTNEGSGARQRP